MSDVAPGRRSATAGAPRRRVTPAIVLAVLVPLLTLGALALVRTEQPTGRGPPPELTVLTRVSLGCPSAAGDRQPGASPSAAPWPPRTARCRSTCSAPAAPRSRSTCGPAGCPALRSPRRPWSPARTTAAPGLLAARLGDGAATACGPAAAGGVVPGRGCASGARVGDRAGQPRPRPGHRRPDDPGPERPAGRARLRGIRVPGRSSIPLDLARIIPRRTELAVQVAGVPRPPGQLGARHRRRARHRALLLGLARPRRAGRSPPACCSGLPTGPGPAG